MRSQAPSSHVHDHGVEVRHAGVPVAVERSPDGVLVADDGDVRRAGRPFPVEHGPVGRQLSVDREFGIDLLPRGLRGVREGDGDAGHHPRRGPAGRLGRRGQTLDDVILHGPRTDHPGVGAVGEFTGHPEHRRPQGRDHGRHGLRARDRQLEPVHTVLLAVEVHGLAAQRRHQHGQVFAHVARRAVVRHAEHRLDHDLVRQADAEREAIARGRGGRHGLLCQRRGMTRIGRRHGRAEPDAFRLAPDHRQGPDGIEREDVRQPERIETAGFCLAGDLDDVVEGGARGGRIRTEIEAYAHARVLPQWNRGARLQQGRARARTGQTCRPQASRTGEGPSPRATRCGLQYRGK